MSSSPDKPTSAKKSSSQKKSKKEDTSTGKVDIRNFFSAGPNAGPSKTPNTMVRGTGKAPISIGSLYFVIAGIKLI
ncbi:hypothetical protein M231_05992 [Tremella mesenterica]|uniref:Uncharacterized protein n=1 Tax=Tremella mesenterica TaxID=5217 RepID=A0A4V1M3G2_TREME|nr:hypothetical protein M231_05992 [Tremella mesenterica]